MLPRTLLILSDMWGWTNSSMQEVLNQRLGALFSLKFIDCRSLGGIDLDLNEEVAIHQAFLHGGIDRAALNLEQQCSTYTSILSFSIGGVIAWKAALKGMPVDQLIAVSSTRLRYETKEPDCSISLHYGSEDKYKPDHDWFDRHNSTYKIHKGYGHDLYKKEGILKKIIRDLY